MAVDPTGRPVQTKIEHLDTAQTTEEQKEREAAHEYADKRLKQIVKSDDMYYSIEYFLLGDPARQIEQLGDVEALLGEGSKFKSNANYVKARYNFETAGKIYLYRRNKEGLRKCLALAQEVTDESEKHYQFQRTILDNMDEALRVSKEYYQVIPGSEVS